MKSRLLSISQNDTSYRKRNSSQYLYKYYPDLWTEVVSATNFLPDNAQPKQRIWHILNDVWHIPLCPINSVLLGWVDDRYRATSSRSAKQKLKWKNGDYKNMNSGVNEGVRKQGNLDAVKRGRKYRSKDTYSKEDRDKAKQTCLQKYGVDNGGKTKESRKKVSDARIRNGATPLELRDQRRIYNDEVWVHTEENWQNHHDKINPDNLVRSKELHLDHIYSRQQGFMDGIPPEIIGHWTNLRLIERSENSAKNMKCHKTIDQLYEDYYDGIKG